VRGLVRRGRPNPIARPASGEQGGGVRACLECRQCDSERGGEGGEGAERGEGEIVLPLEDCAQALDRLGWLGSVDDAADAFELDAVALLDGGEQRLPQLALAAIERLVGVGAVAERVGLGVGEQLVDRADAVVCDMVDREVGEAAQREGLGVYLLALGPPFAGHGLGERARGHGLRLPALRADRTAVERDAPAAVSLLDGDVFPEPFHSSGLRHLRARKSGTRKMSSNPMAISA
jgi:hypothetical protein